MTTGGTPVVQQVSPNTLITGESVAVKGQTQDGCTPERKLRRKLLCYFVKCGFYWTGHREDPEPQRGTGRRRLSSNVQPVKMSTETGKLTTLLFFFFFR